MNKIKLGVIGVGMAWERLHYPAIKQLTDKFEVAALYDKDEKKCSDFITEQELNCVIAKNTNEVFEKADAVIVAVPIEENYNVAKEVINAQKTLFAEKPFASTIKGAEELIALSKQKNVKVFVAENYRFAEENKMIKDMLDKKEIGDTVFFVNTNICNFEKDMKGDNFAAREWRQHPEYYGGSFLDSSIHDLARLRFLFGNVKKIYATGVKQSQDFNAFTVINSQLTFESGITGQYNYFCKGTETISPPIGLRIFGATGEIVLHDKTVGSLLLGKEGAAIENKKFTPDKGYYNEFVSFYNFLQGSEQNCCPPELEIEDIKLVMAILQSIETGIVIDN